MPPVIREARPGDIPQLNAIYGHYVDTCTCTWEEHDKLLFSREALAGRGPRHPLLVVEDGGRLLAWGTLSAYNSRSGWRHVAEDSIFLHPEARGKGLGKLLLGELVARGRRIGYRKLLARISGDQPASLGLHASLGFREVGRLRGAGEKHGKRLDAVYLELDLDPPQP
jgi:phosphinothricin acetyltransferase